MAGRPPGPCQLLVIIQARHGIEGQPAQADMVQACAIQPAVMGPHGGDPAQLIATGALQAGDDIAFAVEGKHQPVAPGTGPRPGRQAGRSGSLSRSLGATGPSMAGAGGTSHARMSMGDGLSTKPPRSTNSISSSISSHLMEWFLYRLHERQVPPAGSGVAQKVPAEAGELIRFLGMEPVVRAFDLLDAGGGEQRPDPFPVPALDIGRALTL